jgi:hypothetical protein
LVSTGAKGTLARTMVTPATYTRAVSASTGGSSGVARPTATMPARPTGAMTPAPAAARSVAVGGSAVSSIATESLRYLARSAIVVRGPSTGIEYHFSGAQPVQRVARADRDALLRSGHFSVQG